MVKLDKSVDNVFGHDIKILFYVDADLILWRHTTADLATHPT